MRVAILTIQSDNFGNRLQNYALQTVLKGLGHDVESLRRDGGLKGFIKQGARMSKLASRLIEGKDAKKAAFWDFDRKHLSFSTKKVANGCVSRDLVSSYDCFVIGSDQVWNPNFPFNSDLDYLPMVPAARKLAYAASFGVSRIENNRERIAELLNDVGSISVREKAGASIVHELTGKTPPVVLDPTLLLGAEGWVRVARMPKRFACNRPFVFKYVLGKDVNAERIAELAYARGLEIVDAFDVSLGIGPAEFVWLIAHSELVCTDSFHASVFALLHHKPLAIFERVSGGAICHHASTRCAITSGSLAIGHRRRLLGPTRFTVPIGTMLTSA